MKIYYKPGDDLKVKVQMLLDGEAVDPKSVPFEVRIWTNSKATAVVAGWDGSSCYGDCTIMGMSIQIVADARPKWWAGELHGEAVLHYYDSEMPDKSYDRIAEIDFQDYNAGEIVGVVDHVIYGLSAYDLAVRDGYVGTLSEWLKHIGGKDGKDASIVSEHFDADGNTIITWEDGNTTVIKRGVKGDDGYTPQKGVDYFDGNDGKDGEDGKDGKDGSILFPSVRVDAAGYLVCDVPDASEGTNFDIDGEGYLCVDFPDVE